MIDAENATTNTKSNKSLNIADKLAINLWIKKFPAEQQQSAIIAALKIVQKNNGGWLSIELIDQVADYLAVPRIQAYEVANSYTMFELKPVGKHKICLCTNISCMLRGAEKLTKHLQDKLNINFSETTADGKFSLKEVECLAACDHAPVVQINDQQYANVTSKQLDDLLDKWI